MAQQLIGGIILIRTKAHQTTRAEREKWGQVARTSPIVNKKFSQVKPIRYIPQVVSMVLRTLG